MGVYKHLWFYLWLQEGGTTGTDCPGPASATGPPPRPTLVDRLCSVPAEMKVGTEAVGGLGDGEGMGEGEAHWRLQKELMKYRRTAKVETLTTTWCGVIRYVSAGSVYCRERAQSSLCWASESI